MARRRRHQLREPGRDPVYGSPVVQRMINCIMHDGKKSVAERIFYGALERANRAARGSSLEVIQKAVNNVKPVLEVKSRRVGGATYQVPVEVRPRRQQILAIRWILATIRSSRRKSGKATSALLAQEICDAFRGEGTAMKKREDIHRMAEANKAFAHFAW